MEAQVDTLTAIMYGVCGASVIALCVIIWHFFRQLMETVTAFKEEMTSIKIQQAVHHERIARVERWDVDMISEIVEKVIDATRKKTKA